MLTISKAMKGATAGKYYTSMTRGDYYTKGGEPPGQWGGEAAKALGLEGQVDNGQFLELIQGRHGKTDLVMNAGDPDRRACWDHTFSAPKSVSVAWALGDEKTRQAIEKNHAAAVSKAMAFMEREAGFGRRGHDGHEIEKVGLAYALFEHGQTRAGDPGLHTHAVVMNVGLREDGTFGALETKALFQNMRAGGEVYKVAFAYGLHQDGFKIEADAPDKSFRLAGVPQSFCDSLSKRRADIERALEERGQKGAKAAELVALDTRKAKVHRPRVEMFREVREGAIRAGIEPEKLLQDIRKGTELTPYADMSSATKDAAEQLCVNKSHFSTSQYIAKTGELIRGQIIDPDTFVSQAKAALDNDQDICYLRTRGPQRYYSTTELLDLEKRLMEHAGWTAATSRCPVNRETVAQVLGKNTFLNNEQRLAVAHLTGDAGVVCLVGKAGTGKSTTLGVCREVWEREGYKVYGAALAGVAAEGLENDAKTKSHTIHSTLSKIERGEIIPDHNSVFLIDEAAMVGTRQFAKIYKAVVDAGGKLVLAGDAGQLQSIEAGGVFKELAEQTKAPALTQIMRQRDERDREAVTALSRGEAAKALQNYADRGLLSICDGPDAMRAQLISCLLYTSDAADE